MRLWRVPLYDEDESFTIMSDDDILQSYKSYWCNRMKAVGKNPNDYTNEDIIMDFVIINWAWVITDR